MLRNLQSTALAVVNERVNERRAKYKPKKMSCVTPLLAANKFLSGVFSISGGSVLLAVADVERGAKENVRADGALVGAAGESPARVIGLVASRHVTLRECSFLRRPKE